MRTASHSSICGIRRRAFAASCRTTGEAPLPVYKMPHLEGWAVAGEKLFVPAVGRHEVLVLDRRTWTESARAHRIGL